MWPIRLQDYSLELFYRESWSDKRLAYDKANFQNKSEIALHESYTNFLWHPDTFMPNAIASKNPQKQSITHRSLLRCSLRCWLLLPWLADLPASNEHFCRLQEQGNVLYSRRLSVVAECPMDLTLFPFDSQICKLGIESCKYPKFFNQNYLFPTNHLCDYHEDRAHSQCGATVAIQVLRSQAKYSYLKSFLYILPPIAA